MGRLLERTDLIVKCIFEMTTLEIKEHWGIGEDMSLEERVDKWMELIHNCILFYQHLLKAIGIIIQYF